MRLLFAGTLGSMAISLRNVLALYRLSRGAAWHRIVITNIIISLPLYRRKLSVNRGCSKFGGQADVSYLGAGAQERHGAVSLGCTLCLEGACINYLSLPSLAFVVSSAMSACAYNAQRQAAALAAILAEEPKGRRRAGAAGAGANSAGFQLR